MGHGILTTQQWGSGHVQRLTFLPTPWHRSPIAAATTNLPTAKTQARTPPNTGTQNTCTCDASSLGTAEARAVRRLDACDVSRCSSPSLAVSSSSSSTSRPNIPARPGHGGPQPGGSPCNNGKAITQGGRLESRKVSRHEKCTIAASYVGTNSSVNGKAGPDR